MSLIVVIEDNVQNARMASKLLRRAGHEVVIAEDGEIGLMTVFEQKPDLVLVDLGLPDIDGQTVIALIRQQEALGYIPLIAFTAWPEGTAHSMAKAYGCDGVITKPIDTRQFATQLEAYLSARLPGNEDETEPIKPLVIDTEPAASESEPAADDVPPDEKDETNPSAHDVNDDLVVDDSDAEDTEEVNH
jgi:two-component system, cell cycle response regulator DivK